MQNITINSKDNLITITIDASIEIGTSKSGKSTLVATTGGNIKVDTPEGEITIGVNAYKPRKF